MKIYKIVKQLVFFAVLLFSVVKIVRFFAFEVYYVPSESMEATIQPGEWIFTNKLTYGARWFGSESVTRLPGYSRVKRNDIVVFNFPEGDSVFIDAPTQNFYQIKRSKAFSTGDSPFNHQSDKCYLPVQNRMAYVKRCIGMPGDTLLIADGKVYCNGQCIKNKCYYKFRFSIHGSPCLIPNLLLKYDINNFWKSRGSDSIYEFLSKIKVANLMKAENPEFKINRHPFKWYPKDIFPRFRVEKLSWKRNEYGPLYIPAKGDTITLNDKNISIYERLISVYEGNKMESKKDKILINGKQSDKYIIQQNYFFMMGDNRNGSLDSRTWGYVPEDHIIGKAQLILYSKNRNNEARWNRMGTILN